MTSRHVTEVNELHEAGQRARGMSLGMQDAGTAGAIAAVGTKSASGRASWSAINPKHLRMT